MESLHWNTERGSCLWFLLDIIARQLKKSQKSTILEGIHVYNQNKTKSLKCFYTNLRNKHHQGISILPKFALYLLVFLSEISTVPYKLYQQITVMGAGDLWNLSLLSCLIVHVKYTLIKIQYHSIMIFPHDGSWKSEISSLCILATRTSPLWYLLNLCNI